MRPMPVMYVKIPRLFAGNDARPTYSLLPAAFSCTMPKRPAIGPYATQNVAFLATVPGTSSRNVTDPIRGMETVRVDALAPNDDQGSTPTIATRDMPIPTIRRITVLFLSACLPVSKSSVSDRRARISETTENRGGRYE
jgi:hypothetical protein